MDKNIRTLLTVAEKCPGTQQGASSLQQGYDLMKAATRGHKPEDGPPVFGQDLYVLCAEIAFQYGKPEMTTDCLQMYFMKTPATNQFLCRAYLCQARLLAPTNANSVDQLEKAVVYLIKATLMAKDNPRYHFLVYNASVLYWQFCRPFLKPRFRQHLAQSLHQVVKALDDIDDKDYEWRAQLMIALIECHLDAGRKQDAAHIATAAVSFIKQHVPNLYKTVFGLMVRNQLMDPEKFRKDLKLSAELNVFYRICKLKGSIDAQELTAEAVIEEMKKILGIVVGGDSTSVTTATTARREKSMVTDKTGRASGTPDDGSTGDISAMSDSASVVTTDTDTYTGDTSATDTDMSETEHEGYVPSEASTNSYRGIDGSTGSKTKRLWNKIKSTPGKSRTRTPSPPSFKKSKSGTDKHHLLLELGRLALEQDMADISQQCVDAIRDYADTIQDSSFLLELEFLQCDLLVKALKDRQESYHPSVVDLRLQAIKRCDEAIVNAVRMSDCNVLQAGCVTQWNLCLPLLQNNLRQHCRRPLTTVASALEDIDSLLVRLRCQVHMEVAKCEEDQEQIEAAITHLKKALSHDDAAIYQERLSVSLHRLELRANLYTPPDRPEDQAAMIIEQARKADSGTVRMKRSLLVRAGQALAPDTFLLVLESENDEKGTAKGTSPLKKLAARSQQFKTGVKKAEGHLRRLGNENDRERARLWGDLAKTARKQEVWDVCRVAARFCLLYDDGRWKCQSPTRESTKRSKSMDRPHDPTPTTSDPTPASGADPSTTTPGGATTEASLTRERSTKSRGDQGSRPLSPGRGGVELYDLDLVRMMAEVNFINGEALIHLLRSEGVQLGDKPIPPTDKRKHPKGYVAKKPEEDPDWIEYSEWITSLSSAAMSAFLQATTLGVSLREPWIVCSAAAYVWNYHNHTLTGSRHREVTETLTELLKAFRKVGHAGEPTLLVNVSTALATGLLQPWMPEEQPRDIVIPDTEGPGGLEAGTKRGQKAIQPAASKAKTTAAVSVNPDGLPDIKRAVEVCEYALKVTNGENPLDVVPVATRYALLQVWVYARQMSQQQIAKNLSLDDEASGDAQKAMTKAMVTVEMLSRTNNGIMEFRECPTLPQAAEQIQTAAWTDRLVELQLWAKLAYLALEAKDHKTVVTAATSGLQYAERGTQPSGGKLTSHQYLVEQEMLCFAACLYGQSLIRNAQGKNSTRRKAMMLFLDSAKFARNAKNYDLVITAARHYWNACLPLIGQRMERELLKEPLTALLDCITETTDKNKYKRQEEEEEEDPADIENALKPSLPAVTTTDAQTDAVAVTTAETGGGDVAPSSGGIGDGQDDLTLRASLYGVLFQSYADKGEWDAGLRAMEQAVNDMPRTNHRLLIFKHLVVVRAKLGMGVSMSIQKFKDEREDQLAHMWRRVALCSRDTLEQLEAYQNAIEALGSSFTDWQKVDYLIEFSQWLYCKDFPLQDATDQLDWAVDVLLNMKFEEEVTKRDTDSETEEKNEKAKGKRSKGKRGKTPPPSAAKSDKKPASKKSDRSVTKSAKDAGKGRKKSGKTEERASSKATNQTEKNVADTSATTEIVPVNKEVIIGLLPANPSLSVCDLCNVTQLEALFRTQVLLAQLVGRSAREHADHCITACAYIGRIWQVALGHCGPVIKDIQKQQALEASENAGKNSSKGKKSGKDAKEKDPKPEKPKRKGPLDVVPVTAEDWACYDAPPEVVEAFSHGSMRQTGVNRTTITKPTLTLLYLDILTNQLRELGYHQMALPLLALADVITRDLVNERPLNALVHLRALEICTELNLSSGQTFHQKLAVYRINEDEQAGAHEEMAVYKERQLQVAKEEQRIKDTLAAAGGKTDKPQRQTQRDKELLSKLKELEENDEQSHLGREIGSFKIREAWTDTAEILIRNGIYQPARELLNEAHTNAQAFGDNQLTARVLYLLGQLSYQEAQYGQAINFCTQAQTTYEGDELFWYQTMMVIVDANIKDFNQRERNRLRKARNILVHSLNVFSDVAANHPNKAATNGYIIARLQARLGQVQVQISVSENENILRAKVMAAVNSGCKKMRQAYESLLLHGYPRDALTVLCDLAQVYLSMARITPDSSDKHEYYVQALHLRNEAMRISAATLKDAQTLSSAAELRSLSTPVLREHIESQLSAADLMLEMLELHVKETRAAEVERASKGAILRVVEELVRQTPDYTSYEQDWINTTRVLGERILTVLAAALTMAGPMVHYRARCVSGVGHCLRLYSLHVAPDEACHWKLQQMEMLRIAKQVSEVQPDDSQHDKSARTDGGHSNSNHDKSARTDGSHSNSLATGNHDNSQDGGNLDNSGEEGVAKEEVAEEVEEEDKNSREYIKKSAEIMKLKTSLDMSHRFLAQANEVLMQAVHLSLAKGLLETASAASLQLVECYGQYDPMLASQYLALHQSCEASRYLERLLQRALYDPQLSQVAALVHQRDSLLRRREAATNARNGAVYRSLTQTLTETSEAFRRLTVSPQHMDLIKEFPNDFNFIILQHSPDKTKLYAAVLDKPKSSGGGGKGSQKNAAAAANATSKAKVISMDTTPEALETLLERFRAYKKDMMQALLKFEYQRSMIAQKDKMLSELDGGSGEESTNPQVLEWARDEERLHDRFLELLGAMATYLQPITAQLEAQLRPPSVTTSEVTRGRGGAGTHPDPPQEYYTVLADPSLMELPLETLPCFTADSVVSVTRDVSLQSFWHKFHNEPIDEATEKALKEKEKTKPPSRIPGLRDASKKQNKIIPLDRPISAGFQAVDTHAFKFICDPYLDCSETEDKKPITELGVVLEEYGTQFTPRWLGVSGDEHTPSVGEYETYMSESSSFLFYGMERFLCHLPPHKVAALNLPTCQMVILLDMMQTNSSFSRQAKADVNKTLDAISLEKPTETALLLSLTGVNSVCLNQWHCTAGENADRLHAFMKDLLLKGKSLGQSVHYLHNPNRRRDDETAETAAILAAEAAKSGAKDAKNTSATTETEEAEPEPPEPIALSRAWYNMVCYGLPNQIVTQIGKV